MAKFWETDDTGRTIEVGDTVKIFTVGRPSYHGRDLRQGHGWPYVGTVKSVSWEGKKHGWFIEFISPKTGYGYWKQGSDGGTVEVISKARNPKRRWRKRRNSGRARPSLSFMRRHMLTEYTPWTKATLTGRKRKKRKSSARQLAYRKLVKKYGVKGAARHWRRRR